MLFIRIFPVTWYHRRNCNKLSTPLFLKKIFMPKKLKIVKVAQVENEERVEVPDEPVPDQVPTPIEEKVDTPESTEGESSKDEAPKQEEPVAGQKRPAEEEPAKEEPVEEPSKKSPPKRSAPKRQRKTTPKETEVIKKDDAAPKKRPIKPKRKVEEEYLELEAEEVDAPESEVDEDEPASPSPVRGNRPYYEKRPTFQPERKPVRRRLFDEEHYSRVDQMRSLIFGR